MEQGRMIAYGSAITGVIILLLFILTGDESFAVGGYLFLIFAGIFNAFWVLSIIVLIILSKDKDYRKRSFVTVGIMLCNIPLAYGCTLLGFYFMGL